MLREAKVFLGERGVTCTRCIEASGLGLFWSPAALLKTVGG